MDDKQLQAIRTTYLDRFIVLAVGRLIYYKGFEYLIAAARLLDDQIVILIAGEGKDRNKLEGVNKKNAATKKGKVAWLFGRDRFGVLLSGLRFILYEFGGKFRSIWYRAIRSNEIWQSNRIDSNTPIRCELG